MVFGDHSEVRAAMSGPRERARRLEQAVEGLDAAASVPSAWRRCRLIASGRPERAVRNAAVSSAVLAVLEPLAVAAAWSTVSDRPGVPDGPLDVALVAFRSPNRAGIAQAVGARRFAEWAVLAAGARWASGSLPRAVVVVTGALAAGGAARSVVRAADREAQRHVEDLLARSAGL